MGAATAMWPSRRSDLALARGRVGTVLADAREATALAAGDLQPFRAWMSRFRGLQRAWAADRARRDGQFGWGLLALHHRSPRSTSGTVFRVRPGTATVSTRCRTGSRSSAS